MPCVCKFHLPSSYKCSTLTIVGKNLLKTFPYYTCLTYPMDPIGISSLSAGTVVGISITILLVSFSAGVLLTAIITYCCWVRSGKSSWQTHISPSEGPMCDEVGQDQDQYAWDKGESRIWDGSRQAGDEGGSYVCSSGIQVTLLHWLWLPGEIVHTSAFINRLYAIDAYTRHHVIRDRRIYTSQLQLSFITAVGY